MTINHWKLIIENNFKYDNNKFKQNPKNILIALSGYGNSISLQNHLSIIDAIGNLAKQHPNINFNIKLHRKDKIEFYENIICKNISIICEEILSKEKKKFIDLVYENDAMITTTSASMFDAFLLQKPVIGIDFNSEFKENEFYKESLLLISENMADLENNINSLTLNPQIIESIVNKAYNYIQDYYNLGCKKGTPQEKTVNQILNLIRE